MVVNRIVEDEVPRIKRSRWADYFFRPLLTVVMIMCFNISLVNLVRLIDPTWRGTYFLIGILLTTIEAIYSYRVLKLLRSRGISILRYRLAEGAILILLLKILSFADKAAGQVWLELQAAWQNPNNLFSPEFGVILMLAFIAWLAATNTTDDFEELHDPYTFRSENILPLDNLAFRFFGGGISLVVISGVTQWVLRAGLSSLVDFQRPTLGGVIFNVMVYFTLGLVMLSQAHLTRLLVRWRVQKVTVAPGLARQWAKYGFLFLGFVSLAVFFLPTSYSLGLLASASIAIQSLLIILAFMMQLLLCLFSLPLMWLFSLLGQSPDALSLAPPTEAPMLPESSPGAAPVPWLEAFRSLVFWLLAIAMGWYLLKIYFNDHPELVEGLKKFKPIKLLLKLLAQLWRQLWGLAQAGLEMIPKKVALPEQAGKSAPPGRWNWFGLRGSSPQERILYYYLNILKRAKKTGPARKEHQTPYEYEPDLSQTVPDAQSSVNLLTKTFVRARYSRASFNKAQAALAKALWQQIRRELRSLAKRQESGEEG